MSRPWAKPNKQRQRIPSKRTLRRWRKEADKRATDMGYTGACEVCFRPLDGRRGSLRLMAPGSFRQRPFELFLCTACWANIENYVLTQMALVHRDWLTPEIIEEEDDET